MLLKSIALLSEGFTAELQSLEKRFITMEMLTHSSSLELQIHFLLCALQTRHKDPSKLSDKA